MENIVESLPTAPLVGFWEMVRAGRNALKEVPGLRRFLFRGILLTYLLTIGLGVIFAVVVYAYLLGPGMSWMSDWGSGDGAWRGAVSTLGTGVLWVAQLTVVLLSQVAALLVTLSVLGLWFESLALRIVLHCREKRGEPPPEKGAFSLKEWLRSAVGSILSSGWLLVLSLFALLVGFVPFAGPFLAIAVNSYVVGRDIRDPYLAVRQTFEGDDAALTKGQKGWTFRVGLGPALLAMVPLVGWVALPLVMVYMVSGYAWLGETGTYRSMRSTQPN